jgi:hypothetical protein
MQQAEIKHSKINCTHMSDLANKNKPAVPGSTHNVSHCTELINKCRTEFCFSHYKNSWFVQCLWDHRVARCCSLPDIRKL